MPVLTLLLSLGLSASAPAQTTVINGAIVKALNRPAVITPRAMDGLFTSVTRAGSRLVAVGERGWIIISDDDGKSWRQVETPTSVTLTAVSFATPSEGWVAGQMGIILKTTDGGLTWTKQFNGIDADNIMLNTAKADIGKATNNDLATANLQAAQEMVAGGPDVPFLSILPLSSSNVLIGGAYGMAFSSADGGRSWQSIYDSVPNQNGLHIYAMIHDGRSIYFAGEQGFAVRFDQPQTFTPLNPPFQGTFFGGLTTDSGALLLFGLQGTIVRTTDGGRDWTEPVSNVDVGIDCGTKLQDGSVLLGDVAGDLLLSHDNGQNFTLAEAGEPVVGITQAADGSIIIAGPFGMKRLNLAMIDGGA